MIRCVWEIGIREDFKAHIFEPFTQEHQSAKTHYSGDRNVPDDIAGMNAHLAKPVNIRKMFQVMSRLRGRQSRQADS